MKVIWQKILKFQPWEDRNNMLVALRKSTSFRRNIYFVVANADIVKLREMIFLHTFSYIIYKGIYVFFHFLFLMEKAKCINSICVCVTKMCQNNTPLKLIIIINNFFDSAINNQICLLHSHRL
jgi:hypothetical protein